MWECVVPGSDECVTCGRENCIEAMSTCSGWKFEWKISNSMNII